MTQFYTNFGTLPAERFQRRDSSIARPRVRRLQPGVVAPATAAARQKRFQAAASRRGLPRPQISRSLTASSIPPGIQGMNERAGRVSRSPLPVEFFTGNRRDDKGRTSKDREGNLHRFTNGQRYHEFFNLLCPGSSGNCCYPLSTSPTAPASKRLGCSS